MKKIKKSIVDILFSLFLTIISLCVNYLFFTYVSTSKEDFLIFAFALYFSWIPLIPNIVVQIICNMIGANLLMKIVFYILFAIANILIMFYLQYVEGLTIMVCLFMIITFILELIFVWLYFFWFSKR